MTTVEASACPDQPAESAAMERVERAKRDLIALLQLAYSGERAAAFAYRGHWKSVRAEAERAAIRVIEAEEWHHRALVGEMLASLGERPERLRELRAWLIGRTLGAACRLSGWLAPMYGAGKLESRNVREYERAARHAAESGHPEWVDCLLAMAEVEWEHEAYFRGRVLSRRLGRNLPLWTAPPPKAAIRESFALGGRPPPQEPARSPAETCAAHPRAAVPAAARAVRE